MQRYYVQDIAVNYQKNLCEEPAAYEIHPAHLHGVDAEEMKSGYRALLGLFGQLYRDIEAEPAQFGMLLRESTTPDAKDSAYTLSNQSLTRVPNLLFVIGLWGELDGDGALVVRGDVLRDGIKLLKITKAPVLVERLGAYGIEMEGFEKVLGAEDRVVLSCADNRWLPVALKAMAEAMVAIHKGNPKRGKDLSYSLNAGLLEMAPGKAPKLTLEAMCRTISAERAEIARAFDRAVGPYAKRKVTLSGIMRNDWGCVYTLAATGRIVLTLNVNQEALHVKMNLAHLDGYTALLDACAPAMRDDMLSTWECGHCNSGCAGGFAFTYREQAYNKCRGGAFQVPNVRTDQVADCLRFLEKEAAAASA